MIQITDDDEWSNILGISRDEVRDLSTGQMKKKKSTWIC